MLIGYGNLDPHAAPGYVPPGAGTGPRTAASRRKVDGCTGDPAISYAGPATLQEWTDCRAGGRVTLLRWDGLAHRWPGTGYVPAGTTGFELIWPFLTRPAP